MRTLLRRGGPPSCHLSCSKADRWCPFQVILLLAVVAAAAAVPQYDSHARPEEYDVSGCGGTQRVPSGNLIPSGSRLLTGLQAIDFQVFL